MRLAPATLLVILALTTAAAAQIPSFDCRNAQTPRERTVCASSKLSDMDARMATAYATLEATLSQTAAAAVQQDQREWLPWLDKVCPPAGDQTHDGETCLMNRYSTRLALLTAAPLRAGGLVIYPRGHYVFVAGKAVSGEQRADKDTGFGYGEFSWPQIDNPTPAQQAWNEAVYAETVKGTGSMRETLPTSLNASVYSVGYVKTSYAVSTTDSHFLDVQLDCFTYGGGAHGNDSVNSFAWWLDKGRALQADDIFAPNSGWHETIAAQTLQKLQRDPGPDALWRPGKYVAANLLQNGIADGVARPSAWTITGDGFAITFGSYEVGPYSSGMPSVHFTWQELQPMLASGFEPAALQHSQEPPKSR